MVFLIRTFVFGLYQVPTGSMETTMLVGERFFADKFTYLFSKPKHGHVISLNSPLYEYSDNKFKRLFEEYVWGPQNLPSVLLGFRVMCLMAKLKMASRLYIVMGKSLMSRILNKYPLIAVMERRTEQIGKES